MSEPRDSRPEALRNRTKALAIHIVKLYKALPDSREAKIIGDHCLAVALLLAQATAQSLGLDHLLSSFPSSAWSSKKQMKRFSGWKCLAKGVFSASRLQDVLQEARELTAIFTAARRTSRSAN